MVNTDGTVYMPLCDLSGDGPVEAKSAANCFAANASSCRFPQASGAMGVLRQGDFIVMPTSNPSPSKK